MSAASTILTCRCGAKLRVPETAGGRAVRCPRCKSEVAPAGAAAQAAGGLPIAATAVETTGGTCPICLTAFDPGSPARSCPSCGQFHHVECWDEVGGCATYGCDQAPRAEKEAPAEAPVSAWGDTKKCPACQETIKAIALKCRYCGTEFDTVDPLSARDLRRKLERSEKRGTLEKTCVGLFVAALFGCLAPIVLIAGLAVVLPNRRELGRSGPLYLVLGYSAIGISALYSILFVIMLVFAG